MLLTPARDVPHLAPASRPTPRERALTWGTVLLLLTVFWFWVAVAADALLSA